MTSDPFDFTDADIAPPSVTPAAPPAYLDGLNDAQRAAVEATDGPVLVLAGAGTGKTRVLTARIAHLIATRRCHPGEVLAVTFTNKAAHEMGQRVESLLGHPVSGMAIGTFHSISARWLRRHAELAGLPNSNFTILDTDDQLRLLKQLVEAEGIDAKRWPPRLLASLIDRWKNKALTPDRVPEKDAFAYADGRGGDLYRQYQARLKQINACDFGDLLLHVTDIFQQNPDVLAQYQRRFRYILVDEYQDTNVAQYLWLRLLAQASKNICCVGDDDQSVYGWRGAEIGNILRFEADFPGAQVIRLERNYRSTGHILGAASGLIAANRKRMGKTLWTEDEDGEQVAVKGVWDGQEEARLVGESIERLQLDGHALSEIAILVRAGFQTREFEERMITLGLPYRVIGGPRFYERREIRDALAYLRVIQQPADDLAFERIVNLPKRGLGDKAMQALHRLARMDGIPLTRAGKQLCASDELRPQARRALLAFLDDLERWRAETDRQTPAALAEMVLEESGYVEMWQKETSPDAPGRLDNLQELVRAIGEFETLAGFLEHVGLVMDTQSAADRDMVSIMTLHGAKGLEFDTVFLPGWEDGVFPNQRALDENGEAGLEEERRLAYVGLTRARRRAIILYAANRLMYGQWQSCLPSRFLDELDQDHIAHEAAQGVYGSGGAGIGGARQDAGWAYQGYDVEIARGPGWERARRRGLGETPADGYAARRSPGVIEGRARAAEPEPPAFTAGERVFHDKFGYGHVVETDGAKLRVDFEKAGAKHVLAPYLSKA